MPLFNLLQSSAQIGRMLPAMHREENLADEWSSMSKDDVKYRAFLALFQEALGPIGPSFFKDHLAQTPSTSVLIYKD